MRRVSKEEVGVGGGEGVRNKSFLVSEVVSHFYSEEIPSERTKRM